ncbi:hypothetical protein ACFPIJ_64235 [Dactylosporangium cerinum]|uniref:Apea-like HEPN domain-containing protein n=1 Tax=Dactylosporangium cerinum TaxID=1434730 RepID=A0ABV9WKT3_9ACTN
MSSYEFGVYEQVLPMGWIGERPEDHRLVRQVGAPIPAAWRDVVVDRKLQCGVRVTMERCGFIEYDVEDWAPGLSNKPTGYLRETSAAALPALVQRLRLVNAHLALLHCAVAMHHENESVPVRRVRKDDLYTFAGIEDSPDFAWFGSDGPRQESVTPAERERAAEWLTLEMAETSLDWLDAVVAAGALFDLDQLSLGLDALGTHDFNTALGAFWYICESRLRKLASAHGLRYLKKDGTERSPMISEVIKDLEAAGLIGPKQREGLDEVREGRNALLHAGTESGQSMTDKCLALATELLAGVAAGLRARTPRPLFIVL